MKNGLKAIINQERSCMLLMKQLSSFELIMKKDKK